MTSTTRVNVSDGRPVDDLGRTIRRRHTIFWLSGLSLGLVLTIVLAVGVGAVSVPPSTVSRILGHHLLGAPAEMDWTLAQDSIIWQVRLPRVLLGAVVGAALAVCGVTLQAMVRNMLADPYLLGVTSGASTGAAGAILFGFAAGLGENALSASAFLGALGASVVVFLVARAGGRITSLRLLLAGVAVGYALYAATGFLIFASGSAEGSRSVLFWLLGSLGLARWGLPLALVLVIVCLTVAMLIVWGRRLDALSVGDETAHALGISPTGFRVRLLVVVSLCVGAVVAASGGIGFVGLVIPHVARRFVGAAHSRAVPVAALLGAVFLVWADVVARVLLEPRELPIGIITALVGAPFLLLLVRRFQAAGSG
ncbi:FecCD family ABC transporter permease [Saccharomonospora viridis]|uniref:ABC transporter permease n=1 Tax=Saccharomonospora viridis TaxID=1852 RepID=A0A837DC57_9PSEU|nr:iron ABC transporter permease [Saccharomonospora viridis]KHF43386.1 ABC transporter permease [Saccharomonospora viridis]SFO79709.1 iron complex transport system permease protein [Saccharomonospora viridis]